MSISWNQLRIGDLIEVTFTWGEKFGGEDGEVEYVADSYVQVDGTPIRRDYISSIRKLPPGQHPPKTFRRILQGQFNA